MPFVWWALRRRTDLLLSEQELIVDATGIQVTTPMTTTRQSWATFRRVRELTSVFALDYGTGAYAMIPKRALDAVVAERVREQVRTHGKLEMPGRWTNVVRGIGLGALGAVALIIVIGMQATASR